MGSPGLGVNMDVSKCTVKLDHSVGTPEPATNWRQAVGFPVFGTGQPTEEGFNKIVEKLNSKEKVIWFNMRQEPVAYIGGLPVALRTPEEPHINIEVVDKEMDAMEVKFVKDIKAREKDGSIEVHKDAAFAENPMDREDVKENLKLDGLKGLNEILKGLSEGPLPTMTVVRVPFNEQRAMPESCFDIIVTALTSENAATTQCIFSSQLGSGRSTLGMVIASIVKAAQMIDINGPPPEGFGLQNLRKSIIQMKYKYDASTEDKQTVWKTMIINYLERYFYIICFATYVRQNADSGFKKTFMNWLDEHKELRGMIAEGKDKLEWTRKVDQSKVEELRSKLSGPDYKEKLGVLVSDLYRLAFQTYKDIPRGPIKDNLMRKLACKTLMEILPSEVANNISQEIADKKLSIDFDTVVGLVVG